MTTIVDVEGAPSVQEGACRIIAEAGANHNNSVERAVEMARAAHDAGAWAIKYQLYKAETIAIKDSPKYWTDPFGTATQFEAFKKSDHLAYTDYAEIAAACREIGITFFATPFDFNAVDALEDIGAPVYKIASADITYKGLLEYVASTKKPVFLSTGAASIDEIKRAVEWLDLPPSKLVILACTLTYPTPDPDANFARIETLRNEFDPYLIGTSDHTLGPDGAFMSAALGAVAIEKHYTLDKTLPDVPDHAMSVDPAEMAEMARMAERGWLLRGTPEVKVRESERPARDMARRSVVLSRDLPVGHVIAPEDLTCKRPGNGLEPGAIDELIGRVLVRELPDEHQISWDDVRPG